MSILQKIRFGAAIVLICAIFLPLSQCSQHGDGEALKTPQALAHARHFFPTSDKDFAYEYGIKDLDLSLRGVLTLVAFVWPLGFAIWGLRLERSRFLWIFYTAELLLCAGTIYWVTALTLGGRWLYGAYVAEVAIGIFAIASLISLVAAIRKSRSIIRDGSPSRP